MKQEKANRIAIISGIILFLFLLLLLNEGVGNPISKALAKNATEKYIEEKL